jgi:hypothetical protein
MQARKLAQKQSSLKEKFQILIDTLRTKTNLKDKIQMREEISQIIEPMQSVLERSANEIMPITQYRTDKSSDQILKSILI